MKKGIVVSEETIEHKIYFICGRRVMLDSDLASLYGVETKYLKRQVRRNKERFPDDFMFLLSGQEVKNLRCHFGSLGWGQYSKYLPYAFTQEGVAMLSGILNSQQAIWVNIHIMRAFVRFRQVLASNKELADKLNELEKKCDGKFERYDKEIQLIFQAIKQLISPPKKTKREIRFHMKNESV
jgi:hypothetical protein